jgi:hypothetical protein
MMQTFLDVAKENRLALSCALLVCLFLTVFGRAPAIPVIGGCALAISIAVLRARPAARSRGNR